MKKRNLNEEDSTSIQAQAQKPTAMMDFKKEAARKKAEQTSTRIAQMNLQLSKQKAQADIAYESKNIVRDLANAYISIYEKKVDQDGDGDNDFADVMIARMVAAGVPKEKAIAMTKNKSYNKEEYSDYEIVASYLLEYNFAETLEDADRIIENMSDKWISQILDEAMPAHLQAPTLADINNRQRKDAEKNRAQAATQSGWKDRTGKTEGPLITKHPTIDAAAILHATRQRPHSSGNPSRISSFMNPERRQAAVADITSGAPGSKNDRNISRSRRLPDEGPKSKPSRAIVRKPKSNDL